jgi:SPP1 gp7 family putative phage head morphogenesis protein
MSSKPHSHYDCLSPYTREPGSGGPTPTFSVQKRFAQQLRGVLSRINAAIRRGVIENDVFNLEEEADTLAVDELEVFETDSNPQKIAQFTQWLRNQLDSNYLTVVGPDRNEFVERAYLAGIRSANGKLRDLDVSFQVPDSNSLVNRNLHQSALQELYTRAYENLQSVRDDMVTEVRDTLLEGFREGENPRKIAKRLTDRVDSIGKHRSTMIARSEIMRAHTVSTLNRMDETQEEFDDDSVLAATHGEWNDANDTRVCPFCRRIDDTRLTTEEMRGNAVSFRGQIYRLSPPSHPQCRCGLQIRVSPPIEDDLEERLPAEVTLVS